MLSPTTEAEISEIIAGATGPFAIQGGGTRPIGRVVEGETLSVAGLSGITLYEPGALTLVARAGTPVSEIEATLAAEGQMLAFEPMDHRPLLGTSGEPTIGGIVAGNVSGPRRVSAGACRDFLLGVRFVDGQGAIVKNGGRVMKNVTGYDLVKLMCGARGTLGVLTEVSLKVLPKPEAEATLTIENMVPKHAVPAMSAALRTPFEVSGAFFGPFHSKEARKLHIRIEGLADSVAYRAGRLKDVLGAFGEVTIQSDPAASAKLWRGIRDMTHLADRPFVARSVMKPSEASRFSERIGQTLASEDYFDWGGGVVWSAATEDQLTSNASQVTGEALRDNPDEGAAILHVALQEYMALEGGHTTLIKASETTRNAVPAFQPEAAPLAKLAEGLRAQFDPRGILNPGLMG